MEEVRKLKMDELNRLSPEAFKDAGKKPIVAILDNIRSLNNVGSFFRTADALGIQALALCGFTGTPPNKEIHKTALGAELTVEWKHFQETAEAIDFYKSIGFKVISVEQTTGSKFPDELKFDSGTPLAFIFGNEVDGVSEEALAKSDYFLEIPQSGTKHSLNVSVCGGIVLWEYTK